MKSFKIIRATLVIILIISSPVFGFPVHFTDDQGRQISLNAPPKRVVSLVPSITEILFALGLQDSVTAITYHDSGMPQAIDKTIIGGFFSPSFVRITAQDPDVVFIGSLHEQLSTSLAKKGFQPINLEILTIKESYKTIRRLGEIFDKHQEAEHLVQKIQSDLEHVRKKTAGIPENKRYRVMRFIGGKQVMAPGDDSFQNETILAAGGIPPQFGKTGKIVTVTLAQWQQFNPQIIYGCGEDRRTARTLLNRPGWKEVDAVRNGRMLFFPCALTCRAAAHTGYFSAWLAGRLYPDHFAERKNQVFADQVLSSRKLSIDLAYLKDIRIQTSRMQDFVKKTLIIDFSQPMTIVSTLEGTRENITTVGNHYSPPPCWNMDHIIGMAGIMESVYTATGTSYENTSFLYTGADMDKLAVSRQQYRDMVVYAVVTAGVRSNAVRMSKDVGLYYEPGTINMILMTNMTLSPRAITRAIISATEAKTAALIDLDIRSSYQPLQYGATGTGTDNIIVVQGTGTDIDNAGGHSKMGELLAQAVYEAVQEAVFKQNALVARRDIFQRLSERHISLIGLFDKTSSDCGLTANGIAVEVEQILLEPWYQGFVASAMEISDAFVAGLIQNQEAFDQWAISIAGEIAGTPVVSLIDFVERKDIPKVLQTALNGIATGICYREKIGSHGEDQP